MQLSVPVPNETSSFSERNILIQGNVNVHEVVVVCLTCYGAGGRFTGASTTLLDLVLEDIVWGV